MSFVAPIDYAVSSGPAAVATGYFNDDSVLDLAVANTSSNSVSVLLGNADGTFQTAQDFPTGIAPQSLAVGDFNADGKLDLATANYGDVSVLLGDGNGGFQAPTGISLGSSPASVAVGDFNGDGKLDLGVTSNYYWWDGSIYPGFYEGYANVLLGTGTGSFAAPVASFLDFGYHTSAAVADFNGDGKQDYATVNTEYGAVSVLLGNTAGLGAPTDFTTGDSPRALTVGDFTGDGILDLFAAGILVGDGNGAFLSASTVNGPTALAPADFTGDGILDLVWVDSNGVSVRLGKGDFGFRNPINVATWAAGVAAGDFNGDGRPDLATAGGNGNIVSLLLNDGAWPPVDAPLIFINDVNVTEGNTGTVSAEFKVTLSAAYGQPVTIHYATADGTATVAGGDYQATSGTVTFVPGDPLTQNITVLVNGDRIGEYNENFFVRLSDPTGFYLADPSAVGTILNDEPTIISIANYQAEEGNSGVTAFDFIVELSVAYDMPVSVDYATADLTFEEQTLYGMFSATAGVDYTATVGTLTIPAGQISGTITVPVIGDRVGEGFQDYDWSAPYEQFFVNLSNPSGAQLSSTQAFGVIVDDEPFVSINSASTTLEGNSGTTEMTFTVALSAPYKREEPVAYDADVSVSYATSDGNALAGSDYVAAVSTVTIPAGQMSQTFTVLVNGDLLAESAEHFFVNLTGASGLLLADSTSFATIVDDDTPPTITISDASVVEGNSGTKLMSFTVSLSNASSQGVWVSYNTANGSATTSNKDYLATSGTLYFAPGETTLTITVSIKGDSKKEKDEKLYVNLSSAIGGTIADGQGVGTIVNDDGLRQANEKGTNQILFASSVDAAIEDWMFDGRKEDVYRRAAGLG